MGWLQRSDPGFGSFIRRVLAEAEHDRAGTSVRLERHQLAVKAFLDGSPYRGLLVYHGLGSGKTCAAVYAAEALMSTQKRVVVMLPASLRANFESEVSKCSSMDLSRLHFVSTNGVRASAIDPVKAEVGGVSLHGSVVIVDEVHNLAGQVRNGGKTGVPLYRAVFNARDAKVVCLSGTIIVNAPYELAVIVNMLSGPERRLVFHKPTAKSDAIADYLSSNARVASFEIEGTRVVVEPVPEGYKRKSPRSQLVVRDGASPLDLSSEPHKRDADEIRLALGASYYTRRDAPRFPETEEDFDRAFVDGLGGLKNASAFRAAALGAVSHYDLTEAEAMSKGFPEVLPEQTITLPMTGTMYERYYEHRVAEIDMEDAASRRKKRTGEDESGSFKAMTRMICNFAFEKKGHRAFKSMTAREDGVDHDAVNQRALARLRSDGMAALRGERLAEQSPKMAEILRRISESDGPALVYSNFRNMEGVGIFALVLEAAGYSRLAFVSSASRRASGRASSAASGRASISPSTDPSAPVFYEFMGSGESDEGVRVFNGENQKWNRRRAGRPPVDVVLITQAGAEGISLRGIRQVHIMEPHWNEVRIQQVIGRAARLGSHSHLETEKRNVSVYRYLMELGGGRTDEKRLRRRDKGLSTDQLIAGVARRKAEQTETFLSAVKRIAVDCGMYPGSGECDGVRAPWQNGTRPKHSLIERDGVLYIVDRETGVTYSYEAFKATGKLVPDPGLKKGGRSKGRTA